jgi:uncharacterized protein (DUF342 family)
MGSKLQQGKDSRFEKLVNNRFSSAPKIGDKGAVKYRDISEFVVVEAGTPLMRRLMEKMAQIFWQNDPFSYWRCFGLFS